MTENNKVRTIADLEVELAKHKYQEDSILTDREFNFLRQSLGGKETYDAFFKFFLGVEKTNGISLAYDIESLPTQEDGVDEKTLADNVRFHKILTRFVRSKLNHLQELMVIDVEKDKATLMEIERLEGLKAEEELRLKELKREEIARADEVKKKGVGVNL